MSNQLKATRYAIHKRGERFAIYRRLPQVVEGTIQEEHTGLEFGYYEEAKNALQKLNTGLYQIICGELFKG